MFELEGESQLEHKPLQAHNYKILNLYSLD